MILRLTSQDTLLRQSMQDLVSRHGAWRVIWLALRAAVRHTRKTRPPPAAALPDHIRQDIGLEALPPAQNQWPLRF